MMSDLKVSDHQEGVIQYVFPPAEDSVFEVENNPTDYCLWGTFSDFEAASEWSASMQNTPTSPIKITQVAGGKKRTAVDEAIYRLGQVTCKATDKDHFTSLQYIPSRDTFVHYDGMATKDPELSRFRKVLPSDFDSKNILPIEVDYFLFKGKDSKPDPKK